MSPGFSTRIRAAGRCFACIEFPVELAGGCAAFAYRKRVCRMCGRIHYRVKFPPGPPSFGDFVPGGFVVAAAPPPAFHTGRNWIN